MPQDTHAGADLSAMAAPAAAPTLDHETAPAAMVEHHPAVNVGDAITASAPRQDSRGMTTPRLYPQGGATTSDTEAGDLYVENTTFMIDRLFQDTSPGQAIRELTVNGLQWLPPEGGRVVWTVHRPMLEARQVAKLCCVDTGLGMTGPKMVEHIRGIYKSGRVQGMSENFGVGGRVATAPANPEGVVYLSWVNGEGAMAVLHYNAARDRYQLELIHQGDDRYDFWAPAPDSLKPKFITDHGTVVVLLGRTPNEDTTAPPPGMPTPKRWIIRYLNGRFFRFPANATVEVHEGWNLPEENTRRNFLRKAEGLESWLNHESVCQDSGCVPLTGATAHWWITKESADTNSGHFPTPGIVAALWQDELFDMSTASSGNARIQSFGIVFGMRRVAIIIEPDPAFGNLTTDTARTTLTLNQEPLPWEDWMAEFRRALPPPLRALSEQSAPQRSDSDHRRALAERLKGIADLFRFSRYRATPAGAHLADPASRTTVAPARGAPPVSEPVPATETAETLNVEGAEPRVARRRGTHRAADYFTSLAVPGQPSVPAQEALVPELPQIHWCSVTDGTRDPDEMDDHAAKYLPETHVLKINRDFRVFTDLKARWIRQYAGVIGSAQIVEQTVEEWFEMQLAEAILSAKSLEGSSRRWTSLDIVELLSEKALTAVVLPRFHVDRIIGRTLGERIGSLTRLRALTDQSDAARPASTS